MVEGFSADASVLALAIAGLTVLVMMAGLAAAVIDRQSSQNSVERIRELVNAASEGIVIAADGIVINVNRRVSELCGQPADDLIGKRVGGELLEEIVVAPRTGSKTIEATLKAADGKAIPVEVVCQPFHSGLRGNEVYAIRDLTERHRNEAKITHMAHHDALTDLPNRVLLAERLEQALVRAGKEGAVAVLCIDLDRFKDVNDALGTHRRRHVVEEGGRPPAQMRRGRPTRWPAWAAMNSPFCRARPASRWRRRSLRRVSSKRWVRLSSSRSIRSWSAPAWASRCRPATVPSPSSS